MEKQDDVLEVLDPVESNYLTEKATRSMGVLDEAIKLVFYVYDADFCNFREQHRASASQESSKILDLLLCDTTYNIRHQNKPEYKSNEVFKTNDVKVCCNLPKRLLDPGGHVRMFFSALHYSLWIQIL